MNLNLQDLLAIWGPSVTLTGFMWYHFNSKFEKIDQKFEKVDEKIDSLKAEINSVEKRLTENLGAKIDAVRDRVSRIEGQLTSTAKVISFEDTRPQPAARSAHSKVAQAH